MVMYKDINSQENGYVQGHQVTSKWLCTRRSSHKQMVMYKSQAIGLNSTILVNIFIKKTTDLKTCSIHSMKIVSYIRSIYISFTNIKQTKSENNS